MVVTHRAHDRRELRNLRLGEPRRGSSMSTYRGSVASARHTEAPLVPVGQRHGRAAGQRRQRSSPSSSFARLRAARLEAPTPRAATSTFSRTDRPRKDRLC